MENKKTLVLSILGVLVLVIAVVGVSFAMYSFNGTGAKENVIQTGTVSVAYNETSVLTLANQYPMTDERGLEADDKLAFTVNAEMSGSMTINYEVALDEITMSDSAKFGTDDVKVQITKNGTDYLAGTATTGDLLNTLAAKNGTLITSGYVFDKDTFTAAESNSYVVKAWVSEAYDLPTNDTSVGDVHSNATDSHSISFKVKVVASQA